MHLEFSRTCVKIVWQEMALEAVKTVAVKNTSGQTEIDIKKYCKVEKIPGGSLEDCRVLKGVMFNKVGQRSRSNLVMVLICEHKMSEFSGDKQAKDPSGPPENWRMTSMGAVVRNPRMTIASDADSLLLVLADTDFLTLDACNQVALQIAT